MMFIIEILLGLMLNILLMIVLRAEIIISTTLRIIYSDCNFSLLAVLSSGIVSDLPCTSLISVHVIRPHFDVIWPHSDVIWPHSDVIWPHNDVT